MKSISQTLPVICLYDGADVENFDIQKIGDYLGQWFGPQRVQIRGEFVQHQLRCQEQMDEQRLEAVAEDLGRARIKDPAKQLEKGKLASRRSRGLDSQQPNQEYEWLLEGTASKDIFYDGLALQQAYLKLIPVEENSLEFMHLVFTNRLIGTWDQSDRRYHARVSIYGWPSVISTTGLVEAPAKPREYYFGLMAGLDEKQLREELAGRFVDHGDLRLTELLKGYSMQAVFYHLIGEPFCDNPDCRLFNAHWQEQMIRAQLTTAQEYCPRHRKLLQRFSGA